MKNKLLVPFIAIILLLTALTHVSAQPDRRSPWRPRFNMTDPEMLERIEKQIENYIMFRTVLSSFNMILYGYLMINYVQLYNETKSKFSLGLVALSSVLLIYSLSSNPLIFSLFRGSVPLWINLFNVIPDVFASIAAMIMIYLTRT